MSRIPFTRTSLMGREVDHLREAAESRLVSGDGPFTKLCRDWLQQRLGVPAALLTTSCTHALESAALLLDLTPGDEVILPSFTFVSTANAFVLRGARPVFVDSRIDTLNMDERQLESLVTPRTRAIVPVHYAGIACEMDEIMRVAAKHNLAVVEDNAHGLLARYHGRLLGTFGALSTLSFHETKNFSCGEGGALIVNDPALIERAEIVREKGTDRSRFFRGQVDKYSWVDVGSSYVLSDLLAAFLFGQFECETAIQTRRRFVWETYQRELATWATQRGARQPTVPAGCEPSWHLYYLLLPTRADRDALIDHLRGQGIGAVFHYVPLHTSPMGRTYYTSPLPVVEDAADRLIRLPLYSDMVNADVDRVLDAIHAWH